MKAKLSTLLCLGMLLPSLSIAQTEQQINSRDIPKINQPITMDGVLDEAHWQDALILSLDYVTWPDENVPAPLETTVYVYENGESLFVGFNAKDTSPENIRAFLRDRDNLWDDDSVGIKIDTYNDHRLAYQFFVNPLGAQADSIEDAINKRESSAWDAIWDSEAKITASGYTVEVEIPLRILNFNDSLTNQTWGMEFIRFLPRSQRLRLSTNKIDHNIDCWVCQLEHYSGFEDATQGNSLSIIPSIVMGAEQSRDITADPVTDWETETNIEPGLDVKWGITPDISLNATINPDFSQVEADVAQLSINNTFALYSPEKRTFFLDNIDYFSSPWDLIYTRTINNPDFGAKLTGRVDKHAFGLFATDDKTTTFIVPGNVGSDIAELDQKSTNAALRYTYNYSDELSVGMSSTLRTADDYHNYVAGVDFKYQPTENDSISFQFLNSNTEYPLELMDEFCGEENECNSPEQSECDQFDCNFNEQVLRTYKDDAFSDTAYRIDYHHDERDWFFYSGYRNLGADFRADLGFLDLVDFNKFVAGGGYIWRGDASDWWNRFRIHGDWDITHNDDGELLEKEAEIHFIIQGPMQSELAYAIETRDKVGQRLDARSLKIDGNTTLFTELGHRIFFEIQPISGLYFNTIISKSDRIDYSNNRLGEEFRVRPVFNWNITKNLQLKLRHTYQKLEADNPLLDDDKVFTANLTDARLTYQFSTKSYLRLSMIRSDITRNADNYLYDTVNESDRDISAQLLYSYKINPQTVFFLGYSDYGWKDDEYTEFKKEERSLFMKMSYAWLL
ncbi:carbohydrate binding family 9 domain-containing protein [Flocculibacter collagenilyticus]|uniref:carbohydrate binding family 9 domain-containing protein n=1 Tax=Flocculibacter collagenilyticus TaxID=2744479 RepID=UPI0018F28D41|nr:carbohydrate binding family 9 domain-containing protein [Flocculibacter collagenilyticus]